MKLWFLAPALLAFATPAKAADKPVIAPAPAWVAPPLEAGAPSKASAGAAIAMLSEDSQVRFDPLGQSAFVEVQAKVQASPGLAALGTISLAWSPATDVLTVHRLRILRDGRAIDCLPKDGVFTILRREGQLESSAKLDGVLTAVVQPEGLQVGDVLDLAYTLRREDPLLTGRADSGLGGLDAAPVAKLRLRAVWPTSMAVRWKALDGMMEPKVVERDGTTEALVTAEDVTPQAKPRGAPARFQRGRELVFTNYADWGAVSALMEPLYRQAAVMATDSPVAAEAKAIAARTPEPTARAEAALALVQEKVRYVAQVAGAGGLTPAPIDLTWSRRFGDCKAKTVLLLALLKALQIEAEPVLASSTLGDGLDGRAPSLGVFDHVLVRATLGGRDYWLDGTRIGDTSLAAISTPDFGFVLPLRAHGARLQHLQPEPLKTPLTAVSVRLDASKGITLPAAAHVETVMRGDLATATRLNLANLAPDDLDRALRQYWAGQYDFITATSVSAAFDPAKGEERLTLDGTAKMDWSDGYEPDGDSVGWKLDVRRDPGPHADAPFVVGFPAYLASEETIVLPQKGAGFTVAGDDVDKELAGYAFHRRARIVDGVFHLETSARALKPEMTLAEAAAAAAPMAALSKTAMRVRPPANWKAATQTTPSDASGYINRAYAFMSLDDYRPAIADFTKALELEPKSVDALANRGLTHAWLNDVTEAKADLDRAEALDPKSAPLWRARGILAERQGAQEEAVRDFTKSLAFEPGDAFTLKRRATGYIKLKTYDLALEDIDEALKGDAADPVLHALRAEIFADKGDLTTMRAELKLALFPNQTDADRELVLIDLLTSTDHRTEAKTEVNRMLASRPTAELYLRHSSLRAADDIAGKEADAKAASALDPKDFAPWATLANVSLKRGDKPGALVFIHKAAAVAKDDPTVQVKVATILARAGGEAEAREMFDRARAKLAGDSKALNSLCWGEASAALDLTIALKDCDASLKIAPRAATTLDSRAFVLLRLGRDREAKEGYDAALALRPDAAASLYGRSLAERRLGDAAAADLDLKAAQAKTPQIAEEFTGYGVTR